MGPVKHFLQTDGQIFEKKKLRACPMLDSMAVFNIPGEEAAYLYLEAVPGSKYEDSYIRTMLDKDDIEFLISRLQYALSQLKE